MANSSVHIIAKRFVLFTYFQNCDIFKGVCRNYCSLQNFIDMSKNEHLYKTFIFLNRFIDKKERLIQLKSKQEDFQKE